MGFRVSGLGQQQRGMRGLGYMYQGYQPDGTPYYLEIPDDVVLPPIGTSYTNDDGSTRYFGPTGWTSTPPVVLPGVYAGPVETAVAPVPSTAPPPTTTTTTPVAPPPIQTYIPPTVPVDLGLPQTYTPPAVATPAVLPGGELDIGGFDIPLWMMIAGGVALLFVLRK